MACAAWKWLGEKEVYTARMNKRAALPDMPIIKALVKAWSQADAIVAQNGDRFDIKWVKARMLKAGLLPPKPVIQIDTLKIIKKNFSEFAVFSASLGYVAEFLGLGKKIKTDFDLWKDVIADKPGALDAMVKYNVQDVHLLEKVYLKVRAYDNSLLNYNLFSEDRVCPTCGDRGLQARGYAYTKTQKLQRFVCTAELCGRWCRKAKKSDVVR
jgi:hypothetical protein